MDKAEAGRLLRDEINQLRKRSYQELLAYRHVKVRDQQGPSGTWYQFETESFWDDPTTPGGNLRVIVAIHDNKSFWRSIVPMSEDFIMSPDGTFVGE